MATVHTTIAAPAAEVWDALVDVRTYPRWLIGARRIRRVDDGWPAPGTAFHHEVGLGGPLTIRDRTRSEAVDEGRRLELDVRARPLLQANVTFELRSTPEGTEVTLEEHPTGWYRLLAPLLAPLVLARNRASLEKLDERVTERAERG
jgi:uncharacterized protein YndB with AHSA1/START domain